ncbi:hypothetical protein V8D89_002449 [Ganoderma adspersum]
MATSTSTTSTPTTVDMQLVEYTFARWVYIDKCQDFMDRYGNSILNVSAIVDTLGSEAACIRALILHGHMAKGHQTRNSRANGVQVLTPLEGFKEALRFGLAAAQISAASKVNIPTRPWERTSQPIFWLRPRLLVPRPGRPVFIPRPLTGPSSLWCSANPSSTSTVSGTDLITAPPELFAVQTKPANNAQDDLSAVWNCNEVDIMYRNGECTVYPRLPKMRPFVVTGLPPVHLHVLHHSKPDPKAGKFHTTARSISSKDVNDTPMLLIWSCEHGDLFVQGPKHVPVLPPMTLFNRVPIPPPSNLLPSLTSLARYTLACQSQRHQPPPPASHAILTHAPQLQPMVPLGRPQLPQKQQLTFPSPVPHPAPGMQPCLPRPSIQNAKAPGPTHLKLLSLTVSTGRNAQAALLPHSVPQPAPQSLSVFQPRALPPPASNNVTPSFLPMTLVSRKKARRSDPTPGPFKVSASTPSKSAPTSSSSAPVSSSSAPAPSTSALTSPSSAPTLSASAPSDRTPPTLPGAPENTLCGLDNCTTTVTPSSWEQHYAAAHGISEETWVQDTLCAHPTCQEAQAAAIASAAHTPPKLTIGIWASYKRHVKQMHFPEGRTHPCTFPGCNAVLSRSDALLRHVESKHKVAHEGRERTSKRARADSEEGSPMKKLRVIAWPDKGRGPRANASPKTTSAIHEKSSVALTPPLSRKGKEVVRCGDPKENIGRSSASASSGARPSTFRTSREDEAMVVDQDQEMTRSEDSEYDDEWPEGDIIEDEMNFDPDNYY